MIRIVMLLLLLSALRAGEAQPDEPTPANRGSASRFTLGLQLGFGIYRDACSTCDHLISNRQVGVRAEYRLLRYLSFHANANVFQYEIDELVYFDNNFTYYPYNIHSRLVVPTLAAGVQVQFRVGQGDFKLFGDFGYALHRWNQDWTGSSPEVIQVNTIQELNNYRSWGLSYQFWPLRTVGVEIGVLLTSSDYELGGVTRKFMPEEQLAQFPEQIRETVGEFTIRNPNFYGTFITAGFSYRFHRALKIH